MRDPTRGGVATVLNEIANQADKGIEIYQKKLPIAEQVEGACEILGLDPLYVANEGHFIAVVDKNIADALLQKLKSLEHGKNAAIIGEVVDSHAGQVLMSSTVGGRRVINMLVGEQLPRIC